MLATETVVYLAMLASTLVATLLGLVIVFQAYRGYRRNESTRMLQLAVGLALITIAPFCLSLVFTIAAPALDAGPFLTSAVLPLTSRLFQITGLVVILYSLYGD